MKGIFVLATLCFASAACLVGAAPSGWEREASVPSADEPVRAWVALAQRNVDKLEQLLSIVSDPAHAAYGNFLTREEIADIVSPFADDIALVMRHFECEAAAAHVQCALSVHRDYLNVTTTVAHAERLFGVTMHSFAHAQWDAGTRGRVVRSAAPVVLPSEIAPIVSAVYGVSGFPDLSRRYKMRANRGGVAAIPNTPVNPAVLRAQYGIVGNSTGHGSMSCAEFEGEQVDAADVAAFQAQFGLPLQRYTVIGPNDGGYFGEGTLDVEYLMGTAPGIDTTMWATAWVEFGADLLSWAQAVQSSDNPPLVHSVSWGTGEHDSASYDLDTMIRLNTEFVKMGVAGLSVLTAAGDSGTGSTGTFGCGVFDATWPASTPYATAVGGTYLAATGEVGWGDSGGGFSSVWPRPSWQANAVAAYLRNPDLPDQKYWNVTGRALPDVAALATNYQVVTVAGTSEESGTSAATPVFAAMIALVNDARLAAGKKPLGFLNPALYSLGNVGTDITSGNNKASACPAGFPAAVGWDAVTGLGTPMYSTLMKLAQL